MIRGDDCGLNFLTCVLQLRKYPGKPQPGNCFDRGSNPGPLYERQSRYPSTTAVVPRIGKLTPSRRASEIYAAACGPEAESVSKSILGQETGNNRNIVECP